MRIYIDESGGFIPSRAGSSRASCVVAVVVPESAASALLDDFVALRSRFSDSREIKGSELTDGQVEAVLRMLTRYDIVVEGATIDAAAHSVEEIQRLRHARRGWLLSAQFCRAHAVSDLRDLRIIALTAYADDRARARVLQAGFDGHLTKPIDLRLWSRTLVESPPS